VRHLFFVLLFSACGFPLSEYQSSTDATDAPDVRVVGDARVFVDATPPNTTPPDTTPPNTAPPDTTPLDTAPASDTVSEAETLDFATCEFNCEQANAASMNDFVSTCGSTVAVACPRCGARITNSCASCITTNNDVANCANGDAGGLVFVTCLGSCL
jgi:hypothetical protein